MTYPLNLPTGYPTNPDGSPLLSPVATAGSGAIPCTTGGTISVTRDVYFTPAAGTSATGVIREAMLELTPLGWAAFNNSAEGCVLSEYGAEAAPGLGGVQDFSPPPNAPYGIAGVQVASQMTYAQGRAALAAATGVPGAISDMFDGTANAMIAARSVNGAMTPLPNISGELADAQTAQQATAWDLYYKGKPQQGVAGQPFAYVRSPQEP